jgi:hypothetical protein
MPRDTDISGTIEIERAIVSALCQTSQDDAVRVELLQLLPAHEWQSGDCRAIYDAIANWPVAPAEIRRELAARLTRMGFPDIEIEFCFSPAVPSTARPLEWLRAEAKVLRPGSASHTASIDRSR